MNNLKKYRAVTGMTQKEFGDAVGVTRAAICEAENGKLGMTLAKKICDTFNIDIYDLLGGDILRLLPENKEQLSTILFNLVECLKVKNWN